MTTRFVKWLSPFMDYVYFDDIFGSMDLCFQIQAWCFLCIGFSFCCSCDNCCFTASSQTNQPVSLHSLWQLRMGCLPWNIIEATSILFEIEFWILYLLWLKKSAAKTEKTHFEILKVDQKKRILLNQSTSKSSFPLAA